jgi:thymidylate synthase (FAD)
MKAQTYMEEETPVEVSGIQGTLRPEQLVIRCARGDTTNMFVAENDMADILADVPYDEEHFQRARKFLPEIVQSGSRDMDAESGDEQNDGGHEYFGLVEKRAKEYAMLERLFRREHWGPFEHPTFTVGFKNISVQTERQMTRHRHATFDVQSLRYVDVQDSYSSLTPKSVVDDEHATRGGVLDMDDEDRERAAELLDKSSADASDVYTELRELGVPAEDARVVLGMGTQINMTMSANLRTYLHILNLRESAGDAQWEIRGVGGMLKDELEEWAPMTMDLWERHGPLQDGP